MESDGENPDFAKHGGEALDLGEDFDSEVDDQEEDEDELQMDDQPDPTLQQ